MQLQPIGDPTVRALPSLGKHFAYGGSSPELISEELRDFGPEVIGHREVRFECPCTRERFAGALASLRGDEARSIRSDGPFPLEAVCHNCGSRYSYSREEIGELMVKA